MANVKPVNLESDTFAQMKHDMNAAINRLLTLMQRYEQDNGALTLKLTVRLDERQLDSGASVTMPVFAHKVTTTVQRRDATDGMLSGEYVLMEDGSGGFSLRPLAGEQI